MRMTIRSFVYAFDLLELNSEDYRQHCGWGSGLVR
jgi:ATP-dependent DNA ligase